MVYGGFSKCAYTCQKFQSDTERVLALILERDSQRWFRPVAGQLNIFYRRGIEQPEYVPDFVAATSDSNLLIETKKAIIPAVIFNTKKVLPQHKMFYFWPSKIEMHFLPDVFVLCEVCQGQRYNRETLNVKYKGKSIADVLNMSVKDALPFFEHHKFIYRKLVTLNKVGLEYITLGQASTSLSGGEAQRVKLATFLSNSKLPETPKSATFRSGLEKNKSGGALYIFDEPTTGLHFNDIKKLLYALNRLVNEGNTLIVIEHNPDIIKCADHVIDLGSDGGEAGGHIVFEGSPEDLIKSEKSITGKFLKSKF